MLNPSPHNWSDLDPHLKAVHLPAGQTVSVLIERIDFQTVHPRPGQEEIKPVMYFKGKQKGLILTNTNQDFLRTTFGDEITACYGQRVTLHPVHKTVAGRDIDTILLALPKAEFAPKAPADESGMLNNGKPKE